MPLLGLGVTGAGVAAVALAVMVGIGQLTGGQAACASSALSSSALTTQSGTVSGIATHYVLEGLPNCSYPAPPANGLFVALSPSEYDSAAACGGYMTVTGPNGSSVTVQVIDQCPECATGHIDLSEPAFAELAPLSAGLINVQYQYLVDPPLPGPVTMEVKQGSSQYWLALLADNTGNPLASVQVETASGGGSTWRGPTTTTGSRSPARAQDRSPSGSPTPAATRSPCRTSPSTRARSSPPGPICTARAAPRQRPPRRHRRPRRRRRRPQPRPPRTTASASAKPTRPSHSPTAHPSGTGTGTPAAKRKRAQAPAAAHATEVPTPTPTAPPTC